MTTAAVRSPAQGKAAQGYEVNVKAFSARGDGRTDDAPAINAAIQEVRRLHSKAGSFDIGCRIVFPPGAYRLESSLNFTQLRAVNTIVDGQGSLLLGHAGGQPVIDALGARWLTIRDLVIVGSAQTPPTVGIQIGRLYHENADDHLLSNVKIVGHFRIACLYNRAAETSEFQHIILWNGQPGSYCLVQDGTNRFGVESRFQAQHFNPRTDSSFNENLFVSCDIRHTGGGIPVWLGDTSRHAFIRSYVATRAEAAVIIYSGMTGNSILEFDCHVEWRGLASIFQFQADGAAAVMRGLTYTDQFSFARNSIFSMASSVTRVELQNIKLEIAELPEPTCRVFDASFKGRATGSIYIPSARAWNGEGLFKGILMCGSDMRLVGLSG